MRGSSIKKVFRRERQISLWLNDFLLVLNKIVVQFARKSFFMTAEIVACNRSAVITASFLETSSRAIRTAVFFSKQAVYASLNSCSMFVVSFTCWLNIVSGTFRYGIVGKEDTANST